MYFVCVSFRTEGVNTRKTLQRVFGARRQCTYQTAAWSDEPIYSHFILGFLLSTFLASPKRPVPVSPSHPPSKPTVQWRLVIGDWLKNKLLGTHNLQRNTALQSSLPAARVTAANIARRLPSPLPTPLPDTLSPAHHAVPSPGGVYLGELPATPGGAASGAGTKPNAARRSERGDTLHCGVPREKALQRTLALLRPGEGAFAAFPLSLSYLA